MAGSAWPELWVPVVVVAHAFAAYFLLPLFRRLTICKRCDRQSEAERQPTELEGSDHEPKQPTPKPSTLEEAGADALAVPTPARLQWYDVGCSYRTAQGANVVLQGAFGSTGPGDMLALLGPSGSGKTTLLDILALRKTLGDVQGRMLLNGRPHTKRTSSSLLAYVPQEEVFPPSLTCEEVLVLWSNLALPLGMPGEQRKQRRAEVLHAVGLTAQAHSPVGGALPGGLMLRGISGGERKRLAVATGLLERPPLIFLDEPTSGLDSASALNVMQRLSDMADAGHTIVASIHQPRAAVWALFTHVVLLSQGMTVYFGPRQEVVPWITQTLGYGPYNPVKFGMAADWIMDLVNIGFRKPQSYYGVSMRSVEDLALAAARFRQQYLEQVGAQAEGGAGAGPAPLNGAAAAGGAGGGGRRQPGDVETADGAGPGALELEAAPRQGAESMVRSCGLHTVGWLQQVGNLAWREVLLVTRNPADAAGHSLVFCWVGIVVGLVFYSQEPAVLSSVRPYTNALFVEITAATLLPFIYTSLHTADKRFFVADSGAGLYHPSAYYIAKALVNLPFAVFNVLTLSLITYGMVGFSRGLSHAVWGPPIVEHMVICTLGYLVASQVLHFAALLTSSQDAAFMVAIAWTAINLLASNTLLRFDFLTFKWVSDLRFISSMWYVIGGLVDAQFLHQNYSCAHGLASEVVVREYVPHMLPNNQILREEIVQRLSLNPGSACSVTGQRIVEYVGATLPSRVAVAVLAVYLVLLHALTYAALLLTRKRERR